MIKLLFIFTESIRKLMSAGQDNNYLYYSDPTKIKYYGCTLPKMVFITKSFSFVHSGQQDFMLTLELNDTLHFISILKVNEVDISAGCLDLVPSGISLKIPELKLSFTLI